MKKVLKITEDIYSDFAYQNKVEDINYLVNELNVHCEVKNNDYINIVEQEKRYDSDKKDYKNNVEIKAVGYSQNEWQVYTLYYNESEINSPMYRSYLKSLITHLERSFTHQNQYFAEIFEEATIEGKKFTSEVLDCTYFCIDNIEFPDKEEIVQSHDSAFSVEYDKVIVETK